MPAKMYVCEGCNKTVGLDESGKCTICGHQVKEPRSSLSLVAPADAHSEALHDDGRYPDDELEEEGFHETGAAGLRGAEAGEAPLSASWKPPSRGLAGGWYRRDYNDILITTRDCLDRNYRLYGLFGWALSGKSSLIYSVGKCADYAYIIEGYSPYGDSWKYLYNHLTEAWAVRGRGVPLNTESGHYHYKLKRDRAGRKFHAVLVDISGEDFKNLNEDDLLAEFFCAYVPYLRGFIFMVNPFQGIDAPAGIPDEVGPSFFRTSQEQLKIISRFLSNMADLSALKANARGDWETARKELMKPEVEATQGGNRFNMPVSICFSQADMWKSLVRDMALKRFCGSGSRVPVDHEAWEFMEWLSPGLLTTIMARVPKLQVAWLSSLGREFAEKWNERPDPDFTTEFKKWKDWRPEKPLGLKSVFDFVISNPPGPLVKSAYTYYLGR